MFLKRTHWGVRWVGWKLGAGAWSGPPVLMLALPRRKVDAAPSTYQSREKGTLFLLCTRWTGTESDSLTRQSSCTLTLAPTVNCLNMFRGCMRIREWA